MRDGTISLPTSKLITLDRTRVAPRIGHAAGRDDRANVTRSTDDVAQTRWASAYCRL
ncbi:MAG: hypothetical protein QOI25_3450 [Mycobacterium sp.]|jgi:hypothetical protein|nr:hypothetical protein [Mycobacterium sp.]MDT5327859.1 hypothetical protein [Mycobacterium sp.]